MQTSQYRGKQNAAENQHHSYCTLTTRLRYEVRYNHLNYKPRRITLLACPIHLWDTNPAKLAGKSNQVKSEKRGFGLY